MNLEKLEIKNFKSYKGEHTIGPFDRFTSIIGPNGSGKSNILDAIIFALNVSTSSMRAKTLEDLLCKGESEGSVRIFLCNQTFERQIIPKGDLYQSIFIHNGNKVSQKNYNTSLEDINIFNKIKNFVICQGDIIKTDVNLLQMIECVCGSDLLATEYKELEDRLSVLNKELSVIFEKRKDLLAYMTEANAGKAKEEMFKKLIEEKESIQKLINGIEIHNKTEDIRKISSEITRLNGNKESAEYKKVSREVDLLRTTAARIQKEYFEKESELLYLKGRNAHQTMGTDADGKKDEINVLESEYTRLYEKIQLKFKTLLSFYKDLKLSINGPYNLNEMNLFVENLSNKINKLSKIIDEQEILYIQAIEKEEKLLSEATLTNFDKINKQSDLCMKIKSINTKISKFMQRKREAERKEHEKKGKIEVLTIERNQLRKKIEDREGQYNQIVSDETRKNEEFSVVMRDILLNKAKKSDLARRSVISNVISNLSNIFSGVHGKVIDIIKPTQKGYELAIGMILASYDYAVIVDNENVAMDCLRYIKEIKACKLTFLPMSRTKANTVKINVPVGFNKAKNCISFDSKYAGIVDFIFGESLIVESSEEAKRLLYNENFPYKICTLDGSLFNPNGVITGGKEVQNKFDENLVERLLVRRTNILNELKVIKDRREAYSDVQVVKERIDELDRQLCELDKLSIELPLQEEWEYFEKELVDHKHGLEVVEDELKEFDELKRKINESKKEKEMMYLSSTLNELGLLSLFEYKSIKNTVNGIKEMLIRIGVMNEEMENLKEEIQRHEILNSSIEHGDASKLDAELSLLSNQLEESKNKLRNESALLRRMSEQRGNYDNTIMAYELQKAKLEEELNDILKYDTDKENAENNKNPKEEINMPLDYTALKGRLAEISKSLQENVPLCLGEDSYISRFASVDREYKAHRTLVGETKRSFFSVKSERMERFRQCFIKIAEDVADIYRIISKQEGVEGSAYIVYEGDPFSNNLKYYLMPPSKRFTEFQNLSGGERSIALLSFIFAINRYKQAPFYIFDEVDAALDRVNVEKLTNYIAQSDEQFIVITLKHKVYQHSNSLIGVYKCPNEKHTKVLSCRLD